MPDPSTSVLISCVSFRVEGIGQRPGAFGWLIRRRLGDLEKVDKVLNFWLREVTVGV